MTQLLVRQRMRAQEVAVRKALTADVTAVHGLLHVDRLVYGERARLAETFAAVGARERLLFGVDVPEKNYKYVHSLVKKNLSPSGRRH